jgi:hypothetical protein
MRGIETIGINKDFREVVKFPSKEDHGYIRVLAALKQITSHIMWEYCNGSRLIENPSPPLQLSPQGTAKILCLGKRSLPYLFRYCADYLRRRGGPRSLELADSEGCNVWH